MEIYFDIALQAAGALIGMTIGLGLLFGLLYLQYREYRNWAAPRRSYWLLKVGAPIAFTLLMLGVYATASVIEGMEALGVFYIGLIGAFLLAPIAMAALSPLLGVSFKQGIGATLSVAATVLGVLYGGAMAFNAAGSLFSIDLEYQQEQRRMAQAEAHPEPAGDAVKLVDQRILGLPDGKRLLVLALEIVPGLQTHKLQVRTPTLDSEHRFDAVNGFCFHRNTLQIYSIVEQAQFQDFRFLWRRGSEAELVEYALHFASPEGKHDQYLEIFEHHGTVDLPMPLPISQASIVRNDHITRFDTLFRSEQSAPGSVLYEKRRCSDQSFLVEPFDYLNLSLYSNEHRQYFSYQLVPRHVAPEFR